MNVAAQVLSPEAIADDANRIRRQIKTTLGDLRFNLTPRNLVTEVTQRTGIADLSAEDVILSMTKRHPRATILVSLAIGVWAFSAVRSRGKIGTGMIGSSIASLGQSGQVAFQNRAAAKRAEFMRAAETQVATGAERLMDVVDTAIKRQVSQLPVKNVGGSLIETAIQMVLFAALEAMVSKTRRAG